MGGLLLGCRRLHSSKRVKCGRLAETALIPPGLLHTHSPALIWPGAGENAAQRPPLTPTSLPAAAPPPLQESGIPGYEQLFNESIRRRLKQEHLARLAPEEATFRPRINTSSVVLRKLMEGRPEGGGGGCEEGGAAGDVAARWAAARMPKGKWVMALLVLLLLLSVSASLACLAAPAAPLVLWGWSWMPWLVWQGERPGLCGQGESLGLSAKGRALGCVQRTWPRREPPCPPAGCWSVGGGTTRSWSARGRCCTAAWTPARASRCSGRRPAARQSLSATPRVRHGWEAGGAAQRGQIGQRGGRQPLG